MQRVHRSALLWLKEWDECVFKGTTKTSVAAELSKERRKKRAREGRPDFVEGQLDREPDPLGRPHEKVSHCLIKCLVRIADPLFLPCHRSCFCVARRDWARRRWRTSSRGRRATRSSR